jgi:hypothetical protein
MKRLDRTGRDVTDTPGLWSEDDVTPSGDEESEAFELLARVYPHEAYEQDPERFWRYFQTVCPDVPRYSMERMLADTADSSGKPPEGQAK